jgi:hypothetical protein
VRVAIIHTTSGGGVKRYKGPWYLANKCSRRPSAMLTKWQSGVLLPVIAFITGGKWHLCQVEEVTLSGL